MKDLTLKKYTLKLFALVLIPAIYGQAHAQTAFYKKIYSKNAIGYPSRMIFLDNQLQMFSSVKDSQGFYFLKIDQSGKIDQKDFIKTKTHLFWSRFYTNIF